MKPQLLFIVVFALVPWAPGGAQTITKCQDAEGNWHYGTYASEICGDRPVTELRESGVTLEVHEAPPTAEELQAIKRREEAERQAQIKREEKRRIDRTLMEKYESEEVIIGLRDQRIAELTRQIEFNTEQMARLREELAAMPEPDTEYEEQELHELRQRLERFERAVDRGRMSLDKTREDYAKLLERYREIDLPADG